MVKKITSLQNSLIKNIILLQEKSKERRKSGLFVVEGARELNMAIENNYQVDSVFYSEDLEHNHDWSAIDIEKHYHVSKAVLEKITYRGTQSEVCAILRTKNQELVDLNIDLNPFLLVVEGGEKPGNLGAILRTADAANIDGVIFTEMPTDLYNPNIIRSSLGACFSVPIAVSTNEEVLQWLKNKKINILVTYLEASKKCYDIDYCQATAVVLGEEAKGVSDFWAKGGFQNIIIPMDGKVNSLNLSNAGAILMYEAVRQRNK